MIDFNNTQQPKPFLTFAFSMFYGHLAPKPLHYCDFGRFALPDVIFCVPWWSLSNDAVFTFNSVFTLYLQLFQLTVHVNWKTQTVIL